MIKEQSIRQPIKEKSSGGLKTYSLKNGPIPAYSATLLYSSHHVIYNCTMAEKKVTGPASYFPSIEKKYGKPIEHWMKELKKVSKLAHMEQVAHLKEKFEMGHGHANAIVAVFRQKNGL